ncbi:TPA: hypothetical protein U1237_001390 [Streptococcus suis]|nr:hypothetical protein [Streptococcus suis]HEM5062575.1 hypothetical protein [Streptococcus suis]HEM5064837.1 hypothetical protein [Streptococcus suis]HEM5264449.1 hypothetical protein [Streptococcus suis]HEM5398610.1 hypothetical protein [Streptococcus suis]
MSQSEIIDSYEELVAYTAEIRESLDILHDWLSKEPKFDDYWSYYDLISAHGQHFALLNLIRFRMDNLVVEHRKIIENEYRGK